MALTADEKAKVMFFLGWPAKTLDVDSTHYNRIMVARLDDLSEEAEAIVTSMLTKIEAVQTKYEASTGRMLVKKVGDIELNDQEHGYLGKEYKRLLRELSEYLDIPLRKRGGTIIGVVV